MTATPIHPTCYWLSFINTVQEFYYLLNSLLTPWFRSVSPQISQRTTMCGTRAVSRSAIRRPASLSPKTLCAQGSLSTTTTTPSVRTCCLATPRGEVAPGACCTIHHPTSGKTGISTPCWKSASSPRCAMDASQLLKSSGSISPSSVAQPGNDWVDCQGAGTDILTVSFALWVAEELFRSEGGKFPQAPRSALMFQPADF